MLKTWPDLYALPFRDPLGSLNILAENYLLQFDLFSLLIEMLLEYVTIQLAYLSSHYVDLSSVFCCLFKNKHRIQTSCCEGW